MMGISYHTAGGRMFLPVWQGRPTIELANIYSSFWDNPANQALPSCRWRIAAEGPLSLGAYVHELMGRSPCAAFRQPERLLSGT